MTSLLIGGIGATELILIVVVLLLLFGGSKLPQLMRGAGKGIREFKDAMDGKKLTEGDEDQKETSENVDFEKQQKN